MTRSQFRTAVAITLALSILFAPVAPAYSQSASAGQQNQGQSAAQGAPVPGYQFPKAPRDYSKGKSFFPNVLAPYSPLYVEPSELNNSPRIGQLIRDGKMQLSLQDAVLLALENNLDIAIQRYSPWIADTDILRAMGGGATRGLTGTGTASVLGSIPSQSFDPVFTSTVSVDHRNTPVNNPFSTGAGTGVPVLTSHSTVANFQYSQGFHTGTAWAVTWNNSRVSSSSRANLFNPALQSTLFVSFTQQLLNGFGLLPNTRFIRIAKIAKKQTDLGFAQQVITTVVAVSNAYWELVFAREDVRVKQHSVDLAQKLYNDNKRQVEIGTLAPLEVVRAESQLATATQDLIVSRTAQLQQQTLLVNLITKNPLDRSIFSVEIIPTDAVSSAPPGSTLPLEQAVNEAWGKRPDVLQQKYDQETQDINVRATRNALLPVLSLFGQYGWSGLSGNTVVPGNPTGFAANASSPIVDNNGNPVSPAEFTAIPVLGPSTLKQAGLSDELGQIFGGNFPTYTIQFNLSVPIRNRQAQADNARALLQQRQSQTRLQQLQNNVVVEVRNALISLEQNQARVAAAQKARVLAEQTLDSEQKKYQLGASTTFLVVQSQRDLANTEDAELRAMVDFMKSKIDYDRALGRTLEANRISIADAKSGHAYGDTLIPGTRATGELVGTGEGTQ